MARRLRTKVKKNLAAAVGVAIYFGLVGAYGLPGLASDQQVTVSLTLVGAVLTYGVVFAAAGAALKVFDRMARRIS